MKYIIAALALVMCLVATSATNANAATEQEHKNFLDKYKKAYEANDKATLESFLYTKGADPMALEFYKMMITSEAGAKITSIELRDLTAEDLAKATKMEPLPNGQQAKLPLTPVKKLVIKVETASANGSSTSTSESYIAEADGKLVIPVPGTGK